MQNNDSFKDEIDKLNIDQLHKALLQISNNCFEIKKLCITVLVSSLVFITTFTSKKINSSIFIGAATVILFFWLLDSQSYFIQEKIRESMKDILKQVVARHDKSIVVNGVGLPLNENRNSETRLIRSLFNSSMNFYYLLMLLNFILWTIHKIGIL